MPALHTRARARPAEATGGIVGLATAVAALAGASTQAVAIVGTLAGLLPAAVTLLVANGGLRGAWRRLLNGTPPESGYAGLELLLIVVLILVLLGGAFGPHLLLLLAVVLLVLLLV